MEPTKGRGYEAPRIGRIHLARGGYHLTSTRREEVDLLPMRENFFSNKGRRINMVDKWKWGYTSSSQRESRH